MARLTLHLLGSFRAALDGAPLDAFRSDKVRALLAYLATEADRPHRRETLAAMFWSESGDRLAKRSLTAALTNLRKLLGPLAETADPASILLANNQEIEFRASSPDVWIDVASFDRLLAESEAHTHHALIHCAICMERLSRAAELYRGDFLAGLTLSDCPTFDDWRVLQAESSHRKTIEALHTLTTHHIAAGNHNQAEDYARRQISLEPWRELAHRQLMLVLAVKGQRGAALAQFEFLRDILKVEMAIEPDPETVALVEQIRAGVTDFPAAMPSLILPNPYKGIAAFRREDDLDFFGRDLFVEHLLAALETLPLVAVVGASGSGKTSVVQAGLLPRLNAADWAVVEMRPGSRPFQALARSLPPLFSLEGDLTWRLRNAQASDLAGALRQGQISLAEVLRSSFQPAAAPDRAAPPRLLLLIDAFEELYTLCTDNKERQAFIDFLLTDPQPVTILLALRADFMGEALSYRPLADALQGVSLNLGPMNREELEEAIIRPAQAHGISFQNGLVPRILEDVGQGPGRLPLLEFALTLLWEQPTDRHLTHAA